MAEAVFKDTVKQKGLESRFNIDSAGTGNYHVGETPDHRSIQTCKQHGVPVDHYARQVVKQDFKEFDYILCMDNSNLTSLQRTKPKDSKATIKLFGEYDPQGERLIQDPYYGGIGGFEKNFQQVTRCSEAFIESLNLE
ncbi:9432_t:CDS:2 [Funneliformis mosseae]|uniref:9432_t:CDS:1 n=1 Tax=Funneliformis mosseae TaxID=27381 RepID=A0A9N8WEH2_FUNMO|nr:9432_t:CDS:2 [Funneliformis mosseae]